MLSGLSERMVEVSHTLHFAAKGKIGPLGHKENFA